MTNEKAIEILYCERACVKRQGTPLCPRMLFNDGCKACDLLQKDSDIVEAYDKAIEALKKEEECGTCIRGAEGEPCDSAVCNYEKRPVDEDAVAEAYREAVRLDDNEDTLKWKGTH